jgi:Putative peptidoglycan-binding domain-containing protein
MALINEKRKELVDAEANRQEIIAIQQETFRQSAVELVNYFSQLAAFDQTHGFYPQAKSQLEEALKIQESVFGPNDPQLVTTLNSLATLYRAMDLDSEAVIQRIQRLQGKEAVLRKGVSGPEVRTLQQNLQKLGFFQGPVDDYFGPSTEVAVISFQNSQGLVADGIVGPGTSELLQHPQKASAGMRDVQSKLKELGFYTGQLDGVSGMQTKAALMSFQRERGLSQSGNADSATLKALGFEVSGAGSSVTGKVSVEIVHQMFPNISVDNTKANLPGILRALQDAGLTDKDMVLMALSTIGIETAGTFAPTVERKSRFNTSVDGHPFDLYDNRLGNQGPPDGERFKGRGYVQITGRARYKEFGDNIGLDDQLIKNPDLASDPTVAAKIFAQYLKTIEGNLRPRLSKGDLAGARRAIAGPTQLAEFTKAYQTGASLIQ